MANRYQREIEEILEQNGEVSTASKEQRAGRRVPREESPRSSGLPNMLSPGRILMGGVALILVAFLLGSVVPKSTAPIAWAGVGLFILAYIVFFIQPRQSQERRWRGRSIEHERPLTLVEWLRQWVKRR